MRLKNHLFVYILKQRSDFMDEKLYNYEVGKRIYERRKQLNMTQETLSELSDTTPQAISNYERGERELKASVVVKIANALNTTTDYLLLGKENLFSIKNDINSLSEQNKNTIYEIVEKCINLIK